MFVRLCFRIQLFAPLNNCFITLSSSFVLTKTTFFRYMNYEYLGTTKKNMDVPHFVCWPCPRENKRFDFQRTNKINQEDVGKHVGRRPFRPMLHPNDNPPKNVCTFGRTKPENLAEYEHDKLYCWYDHRKQNDQKCSNFGSSFPKQMSKTICGLRANWMTSFWFHDLPVTNDVNDNAEAEDWIDQSRNQQQVACQQSSIDQNLGRPSIIVPRHLLSKYIPKPMDTQTAIITNITNQFICSGESPPSFGGTP